MSIYQKFCRETFDEKGVLTDFQLDFPENFNFGYDVVDAIAEETPEKRALVWCNVEGEAHVFSFGDIRRLSNRMANVLENGGIGRGDRVMVVLKRHFEYWPLAVALHKLGAVMIPATHMLTVHDLVYRLESAKPAAVICTPQDGVPERMLEALAETKLPCRCFTVQEHVPGYENLSQKMENASEKFLRRETLASDPMLLYFTSGTTGNPKGVIHDFSYPLAHIVTAKYWHQAQENGLHFTVAETGWAKASWGKIMGNGWWGAPSWSMISTILIPSSLPPS